MEIKWHGDYYYSVEIDGVESECINKDLNCGHFIFTQRETNNALKEAQDFAEKIKSLEMWVDEVACDKKLSKDPFFVERDREIDRLNAKADTECF